MRVPSLLTGLALALVATAPALGAPTVTSFNPPPASGRSAVVPGLSYERVVSAGQVTHVLRMRPGPLLGLQPALTGSSPTTRATLTSLMRARLGGGAVAGVNADYFNLYQGFPSGLLVSGGELVKEPEASRSALAIGAGTSLAVAKMALAATWQALPVPGIPTLAPRYIQGVNRPAQRTSETLLYTPRFGRSTPTGARTEARIAIDGGVAPTVNATLVGSVVSTTTRGGSPIPPGQVVLAGVGSTAAKAISALAVGTRVQIVLGVSGLPAGSDRAIGGGPVLVRNGTPVPSAGEGFTASQLDGNTARTSVGQTADGTVLLVTSEGPLQGSRGLTVPQQAAQMASLGARTAIGMDSGGSAVMALGDRLVIPWSSERPISDALIVDYAGVQLTAPGVAKISPNRDGVDDATQTTVRVPATGTLAVTLKRRGATATRVLAGGQVAPGSRTLDLPPARASLRPGLYTLQAVLTPADGSAPTSQERSLIVDDTLAALRVRAVAPRTGRRIVPGLRVSFSLRRAARVNGVVRNSGGTVVASLASGRRLATGQRLLTWDRRITGKPAPAGSYTVAVEARTTFGRTGLQSTIALASSKPRVIHRPKK